MKERAFIIWLDFRDKNNDDDNQTRPIIVSTTIESSFNTPDVELNKSYIKITQHKERTSICI